MNSNERALHDWFDQELDRLLASPAGPDSDDADLRTAQLIQRLDSTQQPEPDDRFLRDLETRLMPSAHSLAPQRPSLRVLLDQILVRFRVEHQQHRQASRLASVMSVLLLIAVIGATGYVALDGGNSHDSRKTGSSNTSATAQWGIVETGVKWRREGPLNGLPELGGIVLANQALYRLITTSDFSGVEAIDATSSETLWRTPLKWSASIAADDHGVYVSVETDSGDHQLVCLDPANGMERWSVALQDIPLFVLVAPSSVQQLSDESFQQEGVVFVQDQLDRIIAIDPVLGTQLWATAIGAGEERGPDTRHQMVADRNFLLAQSVDGTVHALYRINGEQFWDDSKFEVDDPKFVASDGIVVLITDVDDYINDPVKSRILAIDLYSGQLLWSFDSESTLSFPIVTSANSARYVAVIAHDTGIVPSGPDTLGFAAGAATPVSGKADAVLLFEVTRGQLSGGMSFVDATIGAFAARVPGGGAVVITTGDGRVALFSGPYDGDYIQQPRYVLSASRSEFLMQFETDVDVAGPILAGPAGVFLQFADGSIISLDDSGLLSTRG